MPELWPSILDTLAELIEARGGSLFVGKDASTFWAASEINRDRTERCVRENWLARGTFAARLFGARHPGFITEDDAFTPEELEAEPLYRDFLRPGGIGWGAATVLPMATGEKVILAVNRLYERGPVERHFVDRLDALRPHLARAILMSARLQLERARAASETLEMLGLPAVVLNERGKALAANDLMKNVARFVNWLARDQIALTDKAADQMLRSALDAIDVATAAGVRSFPVRDPGGEGALVAHLVPIRLTARDIFVRCAAALVLTPLAAPSAPPVELIQSLFDLTPAEARVARNLVSGQSVDHIAEASGVSQNTIRTHVRCVLQKTGCNRQSEVVALLSGVSLVRSPGAIPDMS
ncbi:MAG: LuxR C-terminal-related transcriptional regulator [Methylocystis sp.]|uniref:helix-turn-helix transcriptional regulator n=1 Tax=Methylocystis sp. TaxID=1911079 RepID=UPI0039560F3B